MAGGDQVSGWRIAIAEPGDAAERAVLRHALWPEDDLAAHRSAVRADDPDRLVLLARGSEGEAIGLAEAAIRHDWVNGCDQPPVLFLEGLYVAPAHRRGGIARALVAAVAGWGQGRGLTEFASDAPLDNVASHALHMALGFAETERVVFFRRRLRSVG
jgi:aminoglycoside 6'-N-acetyltransferase I